jgi:hypothetical protein
MGKPLSKRSKDEEWEERQKVKDNDDPDEDGPENPRVGSHRADIDGHYFLVQEDFRDE